VGFFGLLGDSRYALSGCAKNVGLENVDITGASIVGALVGSSYATIENCYATGSVIGSWYSIGGLVGWSYCTTHINNCYAKVEVHGPAYGGGLVGNDWGESTTNSYATGNVTGDDTVGGLVGNGGNIINCYATGNVTGGNALGGLVGYAGKVTNSYATGNVTGNTDMGGLVGVIGGNITNSYATGRVIGSYHVGGLAGITYTGAPTNSSYWDIETSGQFASAGGIGRTTVEMKQLATFVAWDFVTIWVIKEGLSYPYFLWQFPPIVIDNIPPVIADHDDVFVEATSPAGAVVNYVLPTATDNSDASVMVTCAPTSGSTFPLGDTTVRCNAKDAAGNLATPTSFIVHVVDTTPPAIYVSAPECVPYGKGNGNKANKITLTAQDNVSKNVIPQITKVEVLNNGGNLVNGNGLYEISGNTVYINPNGNGWSVRITAIAADENGNTQTIQITKALIKC
jgi:hypothetical protein